MSEETRPRYTLFMGDMYYPLGGWDDFQGVFSTLEEAKEKAGNSWWHVVDLETLTVVAAKEYR